MATEVLGEDLAARIAAMVEEMRGAQIDTTGQGISVPEGFDICIFAKNAKPYHKAGHVVQLAEGFAEGDEKAVAFVKFGEPTTVAQNVQRKMLYPKPGDRQPSLWQVILEDLTLPEFPTPDKPQEA